LDSSRAERVAAKIAFWRSAVQQSQLVSLCLERFNFTQPIVTVDLEKTIESVKILEALVRLCLDEVIVSVDAKVLARMCGDRRSLLRRIRGGNTLLIIAAASRFYLRLFSVTKNNPLRRSIFGALRDIKIQSPYLLDLIDRSALDAATEQMLDAATAHDILRARAALDVLLGNGPLAR
jgi:DNA-binding GntR family transcriptional regulator